MPSSRKGGSSTCKRCGKRKKVPKKTQAGVHQSEFLLDPYCSRACCEADLGLGDAAQDQKTGRKAAA